MHLFQSFTRCPLIQDLNRVKGDLTAEVQTTTRLLHQNEKLQTEVAALKKTAKMTKSSLGNLN